MGHKGGIARVLACLPTPWLVPRSFGPRHHSLGGGSPSCAGDERGPAMAMGPPGGTRSGLHKRRPQRSCHPLRESAALGALQGHVRIRGPSGVNAPQGGCGRNSRAPVFGARGPPGAAKRLFCGVVASGVASSVRVVRPPSLGTGRAGRGGEAMLHWKGGEQTWPAVTRTGAKGFFP